MYDKMIESYKRFYTAKGPALRIHSIPSWKQRTRSLDFLSGLPKLASVNWDDPAAVRKYTDLYVDLLDIAHVQLEGYESDYIPTIGPGFLGTGTLGACFAPDAKVQLEDNTSWMSSVLCDLQNGFSCVRFDPESRWVRIYTVILDRLVERCRERYGIMPFYFYSPFDLANQLRGNDLLTDFYEYPDEVKALLEQCADVTIEAARYFRSRMKDCIPGSYTSGVWYSEGIFLSCDLADMVSSDMFNEFGRASLERLAVEAGGGFLHHHELGIHQVPGISKVRGLDIQSMNRDPNTKHMPEWMSGSVVECSLDLPIDFICTYPELRDKIDTIRKGKFVIKVRAENDEEIAAAVHLVRENSEN